MATLQTKQANIKQALTPILFIVVIILFAFYARPAYSEYIEAKAKTITIEKQLSDRQAYHAELSKKKAELANNASLRLLQAKYAKPFQEEKIMRTLLVNQYTTSLDSYNKVIINNIGLGKGSKLPNGLSYGTVGLTIQTKTLETLEGFIEDIIINNSEYTFVIDTISLPLDTSGEQVTDGYILPLSLGIYYYE
jgi:hypothetical protein